MEKKTIVFGATGRTGLQICNQLNDKKLSFSACVRKESVDKLRENGFNLVTANVLNAGEVEAAFKNETFTDVIIALGSKELKNTELRSQGTEIIIEAMKSTGTKARIHVVSAFGVGDSWNDMSWSNRVLSNLVLKSVMLDHQKQEDLVLNSSFDYHIIRPVGLKDGASKGDIQVETKGHLKKNSIMRADVAKYIVDSMLVDLNGVSNICQI